MPLYEFRVLDSAGEPTGEIVEEIVPVGTEQIVSSSGRIAVRKPISLTAYIPTRWGDSKSKYVPALGCTVTSQKHMDKICRDRGLVQVSDLPQGHEQRLIERKMAYDAHNERMDEKWERLAVKHKMYNSDGTCNDTAAAAVWEEYAPAGALLAGDSPITKTLEDF